MIKEDRQRRSHLAYATAQAPRLVERMSWSAEQLAAHRTTSLRALLRVARARSPWHRRRLADVNIGGFEEAHLGELPAMTKDDLMDHFDEIVTDRRLSLDLVEAHLDQRSEAYLLGHYTAVTSSGSSGRRGVFVYDWDGWAMFFLGCRRPILRVLATDPSLAGRPVVLASVSADGPDHPTAAMSRTFSGPLMRNERFPVTLPLSEIVSGLNGAQPAFLHGYPSMLYALAHETGAGRLRIAPREVSSGGEPLFPEIRAALERAWGVRVRNVWGTSEGGGTATGCGQGGTHLSEDLVIVEPVDETGNPVGSGERSAKVYLTNLYNHTLPLIRYEITDEVTLRNEACPCGSAHRGIEDIQGRLDDTFVYGELRVHPHLFRSALGQRRNILEYQVRQTSRGAAITVRCRGPVNLQVLERELAAGLERLGLLSPEVSVTAAERLEKGGTGKLKRFVPLRPALLGAGRGGSAPRPRTAAR
jgi:phenylacetate-CoA ligase